MFTQIKNVLSLAVPNALTSLVRMFSSVVATFAVARIGAVPLSALGLGFSANVPFYLFLMGTMFAVSILVGHHYGAKDKAQVSLATKHGMLIGAIISTLLITIYINIDVLFKMTGQDPVIAQLAKHYFNALAWGMLPIALMLALQQFILGISKPTILNFFAILGLVVNVTGFYTLVFGHFGLPKLGLIGVGYSFSISNWTVFIATCIYIMTNKDCKQYHIFSNWRALNIKNLLQLFNTGWPIGVTMTIEAISIAAVVQIIGVINHAAMASYQVIVQISLLVFMIPFATGQAGTVLISQAIGAEKPNIIRPIVNCVSMLSLLVVIPFSILFWLAPSSVIGIFMHSHESYSDALLNLTYTMLSITAFVQIFDALRVAVTGTLRGFRDVHVPMLISAFSFLIVGIGVAYINAIIFDMGVIGAWIGSGCAILVCTGLLCWRLRQKLTSEITTSVT